MKTIMQYIIIVGAIAVSGLFSFTHSICFAEDVVSMVSNDIYPKYDGENANGHAPVEIYGRISDKPLYTELIARGVSPAQIIPLVHSFQPLFDFRDAMPGDSFTLFFHDQYLQKFIYEVDSLNYFVATKLHAGGFTVSREKRTPEKRVVAKEFILKSSLFNAIRSQGESVDLMNKIVDILSWDIDFYLYPRKGDRIQILYEKYIIDGCIVTYGDIYALRYIGQTKTHKAFLVKDGTFNKYYDEYGRSLKKMFLKVPVKFGVMTSPYSTRRFHPVSQKIRKHNGIDFGAREGTSIFSTSEGTVAFSGWCKGYGLLVVINHFNGYKTFYGHCSKLLVKRGDHLIQGQIIAEVGSTGIATGPHVHYEVRIKGVAVDPDSIDYGQGQSLQTRLLPWHRERATLLESMIESFLYGEENEIEVFPGCDDEIFANVTCKEANQVL